jgi:hypothetical protein
MSNVHGIITMIRTVPVGCRRMEMMQATIVA